MRRRTKWPLLTLLRLLKCQKCCGRDPPQTRKMIFRSGENWGSKKMLGQKKLGGQTFLESNLVGVPKRNRVCVLWESPFGIRHINQ